MKKENTNIEVLENFKYDKDYPCIKCNISKKDFSKIYHLPFDQQYDRVDIDIKKRRMLCFNNRRSRKIRVQKSNETF